jgi:hypothetical protein
MNISDVAARLRGMDRVLILTHVRPDGDTIGSAAALCQALRDLGKESYLLYNPEITATYEPYARDYWAPEVHPHGGAFYMLASFKGANRRRGTAILRAEDPLGPFRPWSDGPVTPADWECLDGTLHLDGEGRPWMVFCHEWVQAGDGSVCALPLTGDLRSAAGAPTVLFHASEAAWCRRMRHSSGMEGFVTDGPFLWRLADGSLVCLWASFSEGGYTQAQARSESGAIAGPWRQVEPLFMRNGGHGMVFRGPDGALRLALHSPNEHLKERPRFIPVEEHDGQLRVCNALDLIY